MPGIRSHLTQKLTANVFESECYFTIDWQLPNLKYIQLMNEAELSIGEI